MVGGFKDGCGEFYAQEIFRAEASTADSLSKITPTPAAGNRLFQMTAARPGRQTGSRILQKSNSASPLKLQSSGIVGSQNETGPVFPEKDCEKKHALRWSQAVHTHPGQRDVLIELFDWEFIETQEAVGMKVIGQFRDLDDPDRFVWLRGYQDMPSRAGPELFLWRASLEGTSQSSQRHHDRLR